VSNNPDTAQDIRANSPFLASTHTGLSYLDDTFVPGNCKRSEPPIELMAILQLRLGKRAKEMAVAVRSIDRGHATTRYG